jgi:hypothetical protein
LSDLLHGEETRVWGDGAYQGQTQVIRECAPRAQDHTQRRCRYQGQIIDEVCGEEPDKVQGPGEGRACVSSDEAEIWIRESALPGTEEERAAVVCHLCTGESVPEPQEIAGGGRLAAGYPATRKRGENGVGREPVGEPYFSASFSSPGPCTTSEPSWRDGVSHFTNSAYSECP